MVKTPVGVSWPLVPLDTVEAAIGTPLRNRTRRCVSRFTMARAGPSPLSSGAHTNSPLLRVGASARMSRLPRSTCWATVGAGSSDVARTAAEARTRSISAAPLKRRSERDHGTALMNVVEEVAMVIVDLEIAPACAEGYLATDLVVHRCDPLPGEV